MKVLLIIILLSFTLFNVVSAIEFEGIQFSTSNTLYYVNTTLDVEEFTITDTSLYFNGHIFQVEPVDGNAFVNINHWDPPEMEFEVTTTYETVMTLGGFNPGQQYGIYVDGTHWKNVYATPNITFSYSDFSTHTFAIGEPLNPSPISTISISPAIQTVNAGESVTIDIYCIPTQSIKGFEFRLSFDSSVIQANSVVEGDIFEGYQTYFSDQILINNTAGTISNVYGLILGQGGVSEPGTLATIYFSAITGGEALIDFIDDGWTGICNETDYLPIDLYSGTIIVGETPSSPPDEGNNVLPDDGNGDDVLPDDGNGSSTPPGGGGDEKDDEVDGFPPKKQSDSNYLPVIIGGTIIGVLVVILLIFFRPR